MRIKIHHIVLLLLVFACSQGYCVERGFLSFTGRATAGDKPAGQVSVVVTKQNIQVTSFTTKQDGLFTIYLDLNSSYEIKISSSSLKDGIIKLSTNVPLTEDVGKFELTVDIALQKKSDQLSGTLAYVWYHRADKKFIMSSQKAPAVSEEKVPNTVAKNPQDPEKIFGAGEKSAVLAMKENEKQRQDQIKNNSSVKAEVNASLAKSMADAEKKKKAEQPEQKCNEEKKEEDKYKKVSTLLVCVGAEKTYLRKVEYKWGSSYYYKNGEQITSKDYENAIVKYKSKKE